MDFSFTVALIKRGYSLDENCPVRDKLLVENGLSYDQRPVRDAIWVEVIGKRPPGGRIADFGLRIVML